MLCGFPSMPWQRSLGFPLLFASLLFPCNGKSISRLAKRKESHCSYPEDVCNKIMFVTLAIPIRKECFCSGRTRCSASVLHRASSNLAGCVQSSTLFASLFDTVRQL